MPTTKENHSVNEDHPAPGLRDILDPASSYSPAQVERLLGIPRAVVDRAKFGSVHRNGGIKRIEGIRLIEWIEAHSIAWQPTEEALANLRTADVPTPPAAEKPDAAASNDRHGAIAPKPPGPGLRDILQPDEEYTERQIESLLGIPLHVTHEVRFGCVRHTHRHLERKIASKLIIAWIEEHSIPWKPTPEALAIFENREPVHIPATPRPRSVLDSALEKNEAKQAAFAADESEAMRGAWSHYAAILARLDDPHPDDAETLASIIKDLGLDRERIEEDRRVIERALKLTALHSEREEANAETRQAAKALKEMEERHKEELRAAERAYRGAQGRQHKCTSAAGQLDQLARHRPELFDARPGQLPQLVFADRLVFAEAVTAG